MVPKSRLEGSGFGLPLGLRATRNVLGWGGPWVAGNLLQTAVVSLCAVGLGFEQGFLQTTEALCPLSTVRRLKL